MLHIHDCQISADQWQITVPDIRLQAGELLVVTGPSGIGKSTFLHWLLGDAIEHVKITGQISLNGIALGHLAIEQRHIGLLMQDVHLFPHLSVLDNLCFALPRSSGLTTNRQRKAKAHTLLENLDLAYLAQRFPEQLSGGERSRVGLIRAMANKPKVLLMDEPFAALDPKTRQQISGWALGKLKSQGIPTIMISHDVQDIPKDSQQLNLAVHHVYHQEAAKR